MKPAQGEHPRARSGRGAAAAAFFAGSGLALSAMIVIVQAPASRSLQTLAIVLGVALASAGLVGVVSRSHALPRGAGEVIEVQARALAPGLIAALLSLVALRFVIHAAAVGALSAPFVAPLVTALCLVALAGAWRCAERLRAPSDVSPPARQPLWLAAFSLLLYLPALGGFGLIDPWEPQYSEVAREMLARRDWISLWWGDQGWFWSKPILSFWMQGASFAWFGLDPSPDALLGSVALGRDPAPEWAARLPFVAAAVGGQLVLQRGVAATLGAGAGAWSTLVLVTSPYWFFLARQTMVDMSYVAPLTAALGFLLLAIAAGPEACARERRLRVGRRELSVSAWHLVFFALSALALAQVLYLLSRHASFDGRALRLHADAVWAGSPGNCALPGNAPCSVDTQASAAALPPGVAALAWAACLAALLWRERGERRLSGLYHVAAWGCVALAFMGKAAPGLVLPLCAYGGWLLFSGRLGELRRAKLPALLLLLGCVAAPWFVQAWARHGEPFFERLFLHDMYRRAFAHVHDTNAGVDTTFRYYIWQLGYGLFPWSGVVLAGGLMCVGRSARASSGAGGRAAIELVVAWSLAAFGLFALAGTKFHHYILPLVPAVAVLAGVWLDELWRGARGPAAAALGLLSAVTVALVARDLVYPGGAGEMSGSARLMQLFTYDYSRSWPAALDHRGALLAAGAAAALLSASAIVPRGRRGAALAMGALGAGFAAWCLHVYLLGAAPHYGQRETIAEYYRARRGPEELLVAYRQNWMGENFYTGNRLATFKRAGGPFRRWLGEQRRAGVRVLFFTTPHRELGRLKQDLGAVARLDLLTTPAQNDKFVLARVEL